MFLRRFAAVTALVVAVSVLPGCSVVDRVTGALSGPKPTPVPPKPAAAPSKSTTGSASVASTDTALSRAMFDIYAEQLASQRAITALVDGLITSMDFGTVSVSGSTASIPLSVTYRDQSDRTGTLTLRKTDDTWYFESLLGEGATRVAPAPARVETSVVQTIADQQRTPANQEMMRSGLIESGITRVDVVDITYGPATAYVEVRTTGSGTYDDKKAVFVLVSDDSQGTPLWFVTQLAE